MLIGVNQCVEQNDLRGLHYIFAEALEADPTFEKYQEDYDYCKKLPGFLEEHEELHSQQNDPAAWDETYWTQLKLDQKKNFSEKRMEHMKRVASVVRKEKIERLRAERARLAGTAVPEKLRQTTQPRTEQTAAPTTPSTAAARASTPQQPALPGVVESNPSEEEQKHQIEKSMSRYAEEYQRDLAREQRTQKEREDQDSKKQLGVVLIVVAVLLVAIVAFLLSNPGSTAA